MKAAILILLFITLCLPDALLAQQTFPDRITESFQQTFDRWPQEKVYLHLDKPTYAAGENIWLKAYLTDATYHIPNLLSKYIYVELINREDSICQRIKLRQIDSCYFGNFRLPPDIQPGDYCIRAYTNWMQNQEESFFFKKNIILINPHQNVNIHTHSQEQDGTVKTTLTLVNSSGKPYAGQRLKTSLRKNNKVVKNTTSRLDDKGQCSIVYPQEDSINNLVTSFPYDLPFKFKQTLYPANTSSDFDLQFFPEGGHLLAGVTQKIAFKAIQENGSAIAVEGDILNSKNKTVAHFKTSHRGMGILSFPIQPGEQYYALVSTPSGCQKKIDLPEPTSHGYALHTEWQSDTTILLSILQAGISAASTPLYLVIHTRGQLIHLLPVNKDFIGAIHPKQFPAGISHFILTDTEGNIYSERLCFMPPDTSDYFLKLQSDKSRYDRRELVKLSLQLPKTEELFQTGHFSIAVTDDTRVRRDSSADNIMSYFLLTSDLKGYIEAPGSYLYEPPITTDLLMLTHGWTRFRIKNLLNSDVPPTPYPFELCQQLHGQVTNLSQKPSANAKVQVFVPAQQLLGEIKTDDQGKFTIRDIAFPDSTLFLIRGYKESGGKHVNIRMDSLQPLSPVTYFPQLSEKRENAEEFLNRFQGNYYYQDGVKIYILEEANVIGHRPSHTLRKYEGQYTDMADQLFGQEELSKFTASTIFQLLMRLPGVYISGENVSIRGGGTPLFLVDGMPTASEVISGIMPEDVDNIGVIKDGARLSFFGGRGSNGVIIINTKHGVVGIRPTPGLIKYYPLGYFQPDEFYMPAYHQPEEKNKPEIDYRSTIYWHPNVRTDNNGHAEISFYTADFPATYTITVEGMTYDGKIYRIQKQIRRN